MATLQDEVIINGMRLRNRVALPPLTTNYANPDGTVTQNIMDFYTERSKDAGLVIVEAMVFNRPIIATDCPLGPREILENGRSGRMVPTRKSRINTSTSMSTAIKPQPYRLSAILFC